MSSPTSEAGTFRLAELIRVKLKIIELLAGLARKQLALASAGDTGELIKLLSANPDGTFYVLREDMVAAWDYEFILRLHRLGRGGRGPPDRDLSPGPGKSHRGQLLELVKNLSRQVELCRQ